MQLEHPLLALEQVSRIFKVGEQTITVLDRISFSIHAGEMVAIMGASGSGKSTLMHLLGCLDHPTAGRYQVANQDIASCTSNELATLRRERFGFIFQRYHLLPQLSAWQNVALAACYAGIPPLARQQQAQALLTQLGLAHRLHYLPEKLSGGQQQRVSIARALMNGGEIILADEPTGALDSRASQQIMDIFHHLHQQGHTIIIVTHDEKIAAHAQRIITLQDGQLISDQTDPAAIKPVPIHQRQQEIPLIPRWRALANHWYNMLQMAWLPLTANRLRAYLTVLSLVIGIASVITSVTVGEALQESMLKDFREFAINKLRIYPRKHWGDHTGRHRRSLAQRELHLLQEQPFIAGLYPEFRTNRPVRIGSINSKAFVQGVDSAFFAIEGIKLATGSLFSVEQVTRQASVAIIDYHAQQQLFPRQTSSIGQWLLVDNLPVQVIGVTAPWENSGETPTLRVWIPYTTAANKLVGRNYFDSITCVIQDTVNSQQAEQQITHLLSVLHGQKDFMISNFDQWLKREQTVFAKLQRFLLLVSLIALVVGSIGIMNILLVSVSERIREIGIRMAIGARQRDIQQQFLLEAVLVCLLGGLGGIVLSFFIVLIIQWLNPTWLMTVAPQMIFSAVAGSSLIGIVAGYLPARRAASLDPVEALVQD